MSPLMRQRQREQPYCLRDLFQPNGPVAAGVGVVAGGGRQTTSGNRWSQEAGLLLGGTQLTSVAWGNSRRVWGGRARRAGDLYVWDVMPQDAGAPLAIGLATTATPGTPGTDGYGVVFDTGAIYVITPGGLVTIAAGARNVRPIRYLVGVLVHEVGATILLGAQADDQGHGMDGPLPIYGMPQWRNLHTTAAGSDSTLYPYVSALGDIGGYVGGHVFRRPRAVSIPALAGLDPLAIRSDRFGGADGPLGGAWLAENGLYVVESGEAKVSSGEGFIRAYQTISAEQAAAGYRVGVNVRWTAGTIPGLGLELAGQTANTYGRFWNDFDANKLCVQTFQAGVGFKGTVSQTGAGVNFVAGQTYRLECDLYGNRCRMWLDGVAIDGWQLDADGILGAGGLRVGLYSTIPGAGGLYYDNFSVVPHAAAVPIQIRRGGVPSVAAAAAQLVDDTFTGSSSLASHTPETGPGYIEEIGNWSVGSGRASCVAVDTDANGTNAAVQNLGTARALLESTIVMPASYAAYGVVRAGHILGWTNAGQHLIVRLFRDPSQVDSDEIELLEVSNEGVGLIQHKVNIGGLLVAGDSFQLRSQLDGRFVHVWLYDGSSWRPRISFRTSILFTGTSHGLYRAYVDEGARFDRHRAYALAA